MTFRIELSRQARRALADDLPEAIAAACRQFIHGPLAENPHRVGKQLRPPHYPSYAARRGDFRVIYDIKDEEVLVIVVNIRHRRDAYRT
jgi:mRNA-degrading endonuclease RelE of RelBE toxin-antitoxin system